MQSHETEFCHQERKVFLYCSHFIIVPIIFTQIIATLQLCPNQLTYSYSRGLIYNRIRVIRTKRKLAFAQDQSERRNLLILSLFVFFSLHNISFSMSLRGEQNCIDTFCLTKNLIHYTKRYLIEARLNYAARKANERKKHSQSKKYQTCT